jgi:hypothetical protein
MYKGFPEKNEKSFLLIEPQKSTIKSDVSFFSLLLLFFFSYKNNLFQSFNYPLEFGMILTKKVIFKLILSNHR